MTLRLAAQEALDLMESNRLFLLSGEKVKYPEGINLWDRTTDALRAALAQPEPQGEPVAHLYCGAALSAEAQPVNMVLHCPACGLQHIDAQESDAYQRHALDAGKDLDTPWTNPPHRSHLCHGCGHIWRPADVPTNGVAAVLTKGQNDSLIEKDRLRAWPVLSQPKSEPLTDEQISKLLPQLPIHPAIRDSMTWSEKERECITGEYALAVARAIERAHGIGGAQ